MRFVFFFVAGPLNRGIAPCFCKRELHRFFKKLEALDFIDSLLGRFDGVKYDESLALCLQICLRDDIYNFAIFREQLRERFFQLINLDMFFQVADIYALYHG